MIIEGSGSLGNRKKQEIPCFFRGSVEVFCYAAASDPAGEPPVRIFRMA